MLGGDEEGRGEANSLDEPVDVVFGGEMQGVRHGGEGMVWT